MKKSRIATNRWLALIPLLASLLFTACPNGVPVNEEECLSFADCNAKTIASRQAVIDFANGICLENECSIVDAHNFTTRSFWMNGVLNSWHDRGGDIMNLMVVWNFLYLETKMGELLA